MECASSAQRNTVLQRTELENTFDHLFLPFSLCRTDASGPKGKGFKIIITAYNDGKSFFPLVRIRTECKGKTTGVPCEGRRREFCDSHFGSDMCFFDTTVCLHLYCEVHFFFRSCVLLLKTVLSASTHSCTPSMALLHVGSEPTWRVLDCTELFQMQHCIGHVRTVLCVQSSLLQLLTDFFGVSVVKRTQSFLEC